MLVWSVWCYPDTCLELLKVIWSWEVFPDVIYGCVIKELPELLRYGVHDDGGINDGLPKQRTLHAIRSRPVRTIASSNGYKTGWSNRRGSPKVAIRINVGGRGTWVRFSVRVRAAPSGSKA